MLFSTSSSSSSSSSAVVAVPRSAAVAIPSASTTASAAPALLTPQQPHPSLSVVFVRRPSVLQSALPPPPAHVRTGGGSPAIPTWMQANLHVRETGGSVNAISPIPSFRTTALGVVAANDPDLDLADLADADADADLDLDFHLELASPTHAIPTPLRTPFSRTAGTCAGAPLPARSSSLTQLPRSQPIAIPQTRSSSWSQPWQPAAPPLPPPPSGTAPALVRPQQQQQQHRLPSHPGYPAPAAAFPLRTTTPPSPTASTRRTSISAVNTTNAEESSEDDGEHALFERGCGRAVAIPAQIDSRRSSAIVSPSSSSQQPHHFAKHASDVDSFLRVHEFSLDAGDASDSEEDLPFPWM